MYCIVVVSLCLHCFEKKAMQKLSSLVSSLETRPSSRCDVIPASRSEWVWFRLVSSPTSVGGSGPPPILQLGSMASYRPLVFKYFYNRKEYSFVGNDVNKFICPICHEVLCQPFQTPCGHLFCKICLKISKSRSCASCRALFEEEPRRDKFNEREILNLIVTCPNASKGCVWKKELDKVASHVDDVCAYQLVQCPNSCGAKIERRDTKKHERDECKLRRYECPYCSSYSNTYELVVTLHFEECDSFTIDCFNDCGKKGIKRKDLPSHIAVCPEEVCQCRYHSLGCAVRLPRKQMDQHLGEKDYHLQLSLLTVSELSNKVDAIMQTLNKMGKCVPVATPPDVEDSWLKVDPFPRYPPCTLKIESSESDNFISATESDDDSDVKGNDNDDNEDDDDEAYIGYDEMYCETFITQHGYKLTLSEDNHDIFIEADDDDDNHSLTWPITVAAKLMILNQEEDKDHITIDTQCTLLFPGDEPVRVIDTDSVRETLQPSFDLLSLSSYYIRVENVKMLKV